MIREIRKKLRKRKLAIKMKPQQTRSVTLSGICFTHLYVNETKDTFTCTVDLKLVHCYFYSNKQ